MERNRFTRRHPKPEERRGVAERCEASDLARSEFAGRHRIPLSSLQRWLHELRNSPKESRAVVFQEVSVCPPLSGSAPQAWAVEVIGLDGVVVRCRDRLSIEELVRLVRGRAW